VELTLRQAHKVVDKINLLIKTTDLITTRQLNVFEVSDAEAAFQEAVGEFVLAFTFVEQLTSARNQIRQSIGVANANEIDSIIVQRKQVMDRLAVTKNVLASSGNGRAHLVQSVSGLTAKVEQTLKAEQRNSYRDDIINISLLTPEFEEQLKSSAKAYQREIESFDEQLLTLNVATKIELSKEMIQVLRDAEII
jgi:hypothetical protein